MKPPSRMAFSILLWSVFGVMIAITASRKSQNAEVSVKVDQPSRVKVAVGEDLKLQCWVTGDILPGPVKWFKGKRRSWDLMYADIGAFPRVTKININSTTDYAITIRKVVPSDAGTYYCVKQRKAPGKQDEDLKSGEGTEVVVHSYGDRATAPNSDIAAAASGTICVILALLFAVALYIYMKKKRGQNCEESRSAASLPMNLTSGQAKDIVYADLKYPSGPQRPKQNNPEEHSEYATIRVP